MQSRVDDVYAAVRTLSGKAAVKGVGGYVVCDATSIGSTLVALGATSHTVGACASKLFFASAVKAVRKISDAQLEAILAPSRRAAKVKQSISDAIMASGQECVVLRSPGRESWQMILPDMQEAGRWRAQAFDTRGFVGHSIFDTRNAAVVDAVQAGYTEQDPSALDRIQGTPSFERGNYLTELVRQVNLGLLSMSQFDEEMAAYDRNQLMLSEVSMGLAQAFYVPGSDTIVLVADRIEPGTEQAVYLHEIIHRNGPWVLGASYDRLIEGVLNWQMHDVGSLERRVFNEAHTAAKSASDRQIGAGSHDADQWYRHELLAYAVEGAVALGIKPRIADAGCQPGDDVAGWLHDVVATLKGLRLQLFGQPESRLDLQEVVSIAHALAQIDNPERVHQVISALQSGGEKELAELILRRTESLAFYRTDTKLVGAIRQLYHEDNFWSEMVEKSQFQAGPFDGGCLTCALGIQDVAGGALVGIANPQGVVQHYGVMIGGVIYDFGGAHHSLNSWVRSLDGDLDIAGKYDLVDCVPKGCEVPLDEATRAKLAVMLRAALVDQEPFSSVALAKARAESALADFSFPVIGEQQMALWRESRNSTAGDDSDVFLEGWVLKTRSPGGVFSFEKEFYVNDETGASFALWRCARAEIGERVSIKVVDGEGGEVPIEQVLTHVE